MFRSVINTKDWGDLASDSCEEQEEQAVSEEEENTPIEVNCQWPSKSQKQDKHH